jgi:hypothetical protein
MWALRLWWVTGTSLRSPCTYRPVGKTGTRKYKPREFPLVRLSRIVVGGVDGDWFWSGCPAPVTQEFIGVSFEIGRLLGAGGGLRPRVCATSREPLSRGQVLLTGAQAVSRTDRDRIRIPGRIISKPTASSVLAGLSTRPMRPPTANPAGTAVMLTAR